VKVVKPMSLGSFYILVAFFCHFLVRLSAFCGLLEEIFIRPRLPRIGFSSFLSVLVDIGVT